MNVSKKGKLFIWAIWLVLFPALLLFVNHITETKMLGYEIDLLSFLFLITIVAILPIIVNDTPIFFIESISLAIFLYFGLFVEIIFSQLATIILLIKLRVSLKESFRFPLNSLMFLAMSLIGGYVYYLLGGKQHSEEVTSLLFLYPILGYEITKLLVNQLLLHLIKRAITKQKSPLFDKSFYWEVNCKFIYMPLGIILYILYVQLGHSVLLYVGFLIVGLSHILKRYHSSERVNTYLQDASEIGHQLAERLHVTEVLDLFIEKICKMLPSDYAYIIGVSSNQLNVLRYIERGQPGDLGSVSLRINQGICGQVMLSKKAALFQTKKQWKWLDDGTMPPSVESIICVPVIRHGEVISILLLASAKQRAYEKYQLMIVDLLSSYFAVAIENSRHYEETRVKSERDQLTNLYNYSYFKQLLDQEFQQLENKKLSLLLLDIDHFKGINDTYGHQGGNDILCQLAARLQDLIEERGTIARYGGEEFAILFPNCEKECSCKIAEEIRETVASKPFIITNDLSDVMKKEEIVHITVSIGVASAPNDADNPMDLIRCADRAMYTGAKQAGRNKVAQYVE